MKDKEFVPVKEFAKILKVTRNTVLYSIRRGKLTVVKVNHKNMIHVEQGLAEWKRNIDKVASAKGKKNPNKAAQELSKSKEKQLEVSEVYKPKTYDGLTLADAERQDKVYKARLSQLKYLEQSGQLLDAGKVQRQAFETGRKVRDAIMSVAPRIAPELAAITDPHTLEIKLHKELIKALDRLIGEKK